MNDAPPTSKDRQKLPDSKPQTQPQRLLVQQSSATSLPSNVHDSGAKNRLQTGLSLHGLPHPPINNSFNTWKDISQFREDRPAALTSGPTKVDPMFLLGAAAVHQQNQQIQNAGLLQSLMDQKKQISQYEEEIRRRMMLPLSAPLLQAHLIQNDPGRLMGGGMGLMGTLGLGLNQPGIPNASVSLPVAPPLSIPTELALGDGRALRGGVIEPFPEKLHRLLQDTEAAGLSDVISFSPNGLTFAIHKPDRFFKEIVPRYFRHKRLSSFKRQLNLYGFELISSGPYRGYYYHNFFVKGRPELCINMRRLVNTKVSRAKTRQDQPDFLLSPPPTSKKGEKIEKCSGIHPSIARAEDTNQSSEPTFDSTSE
jgi:hypothetical protein